MMRSDSEQLIRRACTVIETEAAAVAALATRLDHGFTAASQLCLDCRGRIVVTGMGKSGHIANKIAATLASTGTPAFYVHPGEASHGDLGMIVGEDVVLAVSNSGETAELLAILPLVKRLGVPLIALTGQPASTLARIATVNLDVSVVQEACPLNLSPTASTTAALAMGDALAIALLDARGFTEEDFARAHPGGNLGRRLLLRVEDLMHTGQAMPTVGEATPLSEALAEMSRKGLGMTCIIDSERRVLGVFTDGDIRRVLDRQLDINRTPIRAVMTSDCVTAAPELLAAAAIRIMHEHLITTLPVVNADRALVGVLHMHDLLRAGIA
jgi:arabinose-5-phosphate isomerase